MIDLKAYRGQHRQLLELASSFAEQAAQVRTRADAEACERMLGVVDRALTEHLRSEDHELYPSLIASIDPAVSLLAKGLFEEMGGIRSAWGSYRDQWTPARIFAEPQRFNQATAAFVHALAARIEKEEAELYPAVEPIAGPKCVSTVSGLVITPS